MWSTHPASVHNVRILGDRLLLGPELRIGRPFPMRFGSWVASCPSRTGDGPIISAGAVGSINSRGITVFSLTRQRQLLLPVPLANRRGRQGQCARTWSYSNCTCIFCGSQKQELKQFGVAAMGAKISAMRLLTVAGFVFLGTVRASEQNAPAPELPRPAVDVPGITPEVLSRTMVPGAPWKVAIATRVTYEPGARIRKHYHTSQAVFYILEGTMIVQDDGKNPVTLKAGDSLLIKPGTVHAHWNASTTAKLVFTEFILVDEGQRSAVFVEP